MAVVFLKVLDGRPGEVWHIAGEPTFEQHILPLCLALGLRLLPSALQGFRVSPDDVLVLRDDFVRLRHHVSNRWLLKPKFLRKRVPGACDAAMRALNAIADDPGGEWFLLSSYRPQHATGLEPFDTESLMTLGEPVDVSPCLQELYSLTSLAEWRGATGRCKSFGWAVDEERPDDGVAWFLPAPGLRVYVDTGATAARPFGCLVLYRFEEVAPEMAEFYRAGRADYDGAYDRVLSTVIASLGEPVARGDYRHAHRPEWPYHYADWPGEAGVLILRQDELDIQCGMDVNLWVQPWDPSEPLPKPPIDF